jgi:DNA polymerase III subunit delta
MQPDQLLRMLKLQQPDSVYLFIGPEAYRRSACRSLLLEKAVGEGDRVEGFTRLDLDTLSLAEVLDDARSMSLFAANRLIWVTSTESVLPRGRAAAADDSAGHEGDAELLASYCKSPTPGVVIVFDARKWDLDGEDKARIDRLRKFFSPVRSVVEFARMSPDQARLHARTIAAERGLAIKGAELDLLVETTGADASRIAIELEKLALFAQAQNRPVSAADIAALVPDAQESTIFALVDALARRDRRESMEVLDTLVKEGEYLPLALTFLGGLFRMALAAQEQGLRSAQEVLDHFQRQGVAMWRSRAVQIYAASAKFPKKKLEEALRSVFRADRDLKSTRPDDRLVMEEFVLRLTS